MCSCLWKMSILHHPYTCEHNRRLARMPLPIVWSVILLVSQGPQCGANESGGPTLFLSIQNIVDIVDTTIDPSPMYTHRKQWPTVR